MAKQGIARQAAANYVGRVFLQDSSSVSGAGLTGLTSASSGLEIHVMREIDATPTDYTVAGSTIEAVTTLGTYAAPTATKVRFKKIDDSKMPGFYELQIAVALTGIGDASRTLVGIIFGATNLAPCPFELELQAIDMQNLVLPAGAMPAFGVVDNGTATAATGTTLTTRSLAYTPAADAFKDRLLWIVTGTGRDQCVTIDSSTAANPSVLTFTAPPTAPSGTPTYIIGAQASGSQTNRPQVDVQSVLAHQIAGDGSATPFHV